MGKNHHYVPRVYLKRFSEDQRKDKEKVWVFDKKNSSSFSTNVKNVASENKFYTMRQEDMKEGVNVEVVEDTLSTFEGDYVETIDEILG